MQKKGTHLTKYISNRNRQSQNSKPPRFQPKSPVLQNRIMSCKNKIQLKKNIIYIILILLNCLCKKYIFIFLFIYMQNHIIN